MKKNKAIIFDLDETLLDEKAYRLSLFEKLISFIKYKNKKFSLKKIKNYDFIKKNIYKFKILDFILNRYLRNESLIKLKNVYYSSAHIPLFKNTESVLKKLKKKIYFMFNN